MEDLTLGQQLEVARSQIEKLSEWYYLKKIEWGEESARLQAELRAEYAKKESILQQVQEREVALSLEPGVLNHASLT